MKPSDIVQRLRQYKVSDRDRLLSEASHEIERLQRRYDGAMVEQHRLDGEIERLRDTSSSGTTELVLEIDRLTKENERLRAALEFYADPESYFAVAVIPDPPCGDFAHDWSDDHGHEQLTGPRYGKRAREALR